MALTHRYTLLCDEIRQELNGKYILLGLYTPDIIVPAIPFVLPTLAFFTLLESDAAEQCEFSVRLTVGENQIMAVNGAANFGRPGVAIFPMRFGPVQLQTEGEYLFVLESPQLDGPVEHRFRVV